ncbi:HlyD family efflux transporter periplasmic adaptor subunit [Methylomicrobium sp. Wu6]|uniref:efflux RND transporter periplasmic adaptor subunit n=1 Tax=Methylomicrobium sp. Wu6 TaxID=3107928 RepID=UPI002DD64CDC|nr:HlyD family efflux transporter periplasmic adaptor subunit [Methylomicrobium sp. Wu6]MEC4747870.1 efflux RND transporter periplasmic adaptor subunit [Methylomicrobium sp. Wu6]
MLPKYTMPVLAAAGFLFGVFQVVSSNKPVPIAPAAAEPAASPYQTFIAGAGIVEAKSQNISIGSPLAGIVKSVKVKVGDRVRLGDTLFFVDDRAALADLAVREADLAKAKAAIGEAEAGLHDAKVLQHLADSVTDLRAISTEELKRRRNATLIARSKLVSADAQVQQAQAAVKMSLTTLDLLNVKAPVNGEVLQVNVRPGEFAQAGPLATPLMIVGNLDELHIRVDIDENDAWRFRPNSKAVAYLRGNRRFQTDLTLAWVEPFVVPKKSLTGDSTERVDTRVLQALYSFDRKKLPVFVGQQMDVFIEAPGFDEESAPVNAKPSTPPA